jgi:signal transduction histidine kinase
MKSNNALLAHLQHADRARQTSSAVINASGRQRMLSQRIALLSLQWVNTPTGAERDGLRRALLEAIDLMERTHFGLLEGDASQGLPGQPSARVRQLYFQPPWNLDRRVRAYLDRARALVNLPEGEVTPQHPDLQAMLADARSPLLDAIDTLVSQYQVESETEHAELYRQSCTATAAERAKAEQLEQALRELQQTQAQLIHAEKIATLGQLVAGLAHEINNPINFLCGNLAHARAYADDLLELVRRYERGEDARSHLEAIDLDFIAADLPELLGSMQIGVDRIAQVVTSLRTFSRTDEDRNEWVDLHQGLDATLLILKSRLKPRSHFSGVEVIKEYGNLPPVECCPGQLNQVFTNILSNAIDALEEEVSQSPHKRAQIRIQTELIEGDRVAVRIIDNGPGISESARAQLFDPFFTTKPAGKGTGLGMSISDRIVRQRHRGRIQCRSRLGEGTEFSIEIPRSQGLESSFKPSTSAA